jgi:hypothetical protein
MEIGRNAPCPCGSGKKYKKCCATKDVRARREVADSLEQMLLPSEEASVYTVWSQWCLGMDKLAFAFLYELLSPQSEMRSSFSGSEQFEAACKADNIVLPAGSKACFKSLLIQENRSAYLLQTIGEEDRTQSKIRCECLEFIRTELGWRISALTSQVISRARLSEISLPAYRSGALVEQ